MEPMNYIPPKQQKYSRAEKAVRKQRSEEAIVMQEIEGNPFTPEDLALLKKMDREGWSDEERRAYILGMFRPALAAQ